MYSKKVVEAFVKEREEKQVFQAVQPARGKTVSEAIDARWQMDLISFVNQPVVVGGKTFKWIMEYVRPGDADEGAGGGAGVLGEDLRPRAEDP